MSTRGVIVLLCVMGLALNAQDIIQPDIPLSDKSLAQLRIELVRLQSEFDSASTPRAKDAINEKSFYIIQELFKRGEMPKEEDV